MNRPFQPPSSRSAGHTLPRPGVAEVAPGPMPGGSRSGATEQHPRAPAEGRDLISSDASLPPSLESWLTPFRFGLVLFACILAAYPQVVLGAETFFYRDYGCFGYPLAHFHRESFWRGELPLWNPLSNGGLPHLAQWNTLILYPGSLLYLLLPLPWSLGWFCLAHLFFAGLAMYFLAHHWTANRLAAAVGGLGFAFTGFTLHAVMWPNNIAALAWMPLVVLFADRAWQRGGRALVPAALAGAMQMLAGAPEIILFTWLVVMAVGLAETRWNLRKLLRVLTVLALIAGIAAIQLLPFLELLSLSQRGRQFDTGVWSMPPWGWANFLVPLFRCTPSVTGVWSQDAQQWTPSYYTGIGIVALALFAVLRSRERRVRVLALVAVAGLLLALGENGFALPALRELLPALGSVRFPIKFVVLALFVLPLLAASGLAHWQRTAPANTPRNHRREEAEPSTRNSLRDQRGGDGICGLSIAVLLLASVGFLAWLARGQGTLDSHWTTLWQNSVARAVFLVLGCMAVLGLKLATAPLPALAARVGLLVVLALDVLTHAPRANPTVITDAYSPRAVPREWRLSNGEGRAMISPRTQQFLDYAANPDALTLCTGQRRALFPNWNLLEGIPMTSGFYSLYTREQRDVSSLFYERTNFPAPLADFFGVRLISADAELFAWRPRETALPLVTVGQQPIYSDEAATLRALAAPEFNPRRAVHLPLTAQPLAGVTHTSNARIIRTEVKSAALDIEVESPVSTLVTIAQTHYPAWRATVNGQPAPLLRANHAFQAVPVPAGRSQLRLTCDDRRFKAGALISSLSLGLTLLLWRHFRSRGRQARETPAASVNLPSP